MVSPRWRHPHRPTDPEWGRRGSSPSATPTSPGKPAAGRGSSNDSTTYADALGPTAYYDNPSHTAEQIPRCHRSQSAEAYIGGGVSGVNLACSGARTSTYVDSNNRFKPGLDFYDDGAGHLGQAKALQLFATTHNVTMVAVSIGGNDFNFGSIVQTCVTDFLGSPVWWKDYCNDDSSVASNFTAGNVATVESRIAAAYQNLRTAMRNAGYADASWTMLVQTYPSPLPHGSGIRYDESGYSRQNVGGCGRRLCEGTVGLCEEEGLTSWTQPGAVDRTEWVNQIRTVSTAGDSPYYIQESLHPNYWAQLATRSCVRQAYNGGSPRGGSCAIAGTGMSGGEPRMTFQATG